MATFSIKLVFLWCMCINQIAAKSKFINTSLCIANRENRDECESFEMTNSIIYLFTDIPRKSNVVNVYLTSGNHFLTQDFDFHREKRIVLQGISVAKPSVIFCQNTAIGFSNMYQVEILISNVVFKNCGRETSIIWKFEERSIPIALYMFKRAYYTLENVTISHTGGVGLYSNGCREQIIKNCTFIDNRLGGAVMVLSEDSIHITETKFFNTSTMFGGLQILFDEKGQFDKVVTLSNSKFHQNLAPTGSHLLIHKKVGTRLINVTIENCTFTEAHGPGYAAMFRSLDEALGQRLVFRMIALVSTSL